LSFLRISDTK